MGPVLDQSCGGFTQICGLLGILSWSATETYWKSTMSEWENNSVTKRIRTGTVRSVAEKTRASATYKRRCGCPHSSTKQALRNRNVKDGCWRSKTKNSVITFFLYIISSWGVGNYWNIWWCWLYTRTRTEYERLISYACVYASARKWSLGIIRALMGQFPTAHCLTFH